MVIQRSWKILGDTCSMSASSTEANRSPMGGMNSSSDDSNCSNQTTHSMVTSVSSPPNGPAKIESTSTTSNTFNQNQITNSNQNHSQQIATETMKFVTTPQMAEITLQKLRQRFSNTTPLTNSSAESAMRSLELLRIAVQSEFDKEVDEMIKHFIDTYFKPAFNNIKENLGQGAINDDALQKMSCALLENAKSQYKTLRYKSQSATNSNAVTTSSNISENNTMRMALKRPALIRPISTVNEMQKKFLPESEVLQQQTPLDVIPSVGTLKATIPQNQDSAGFTPSHQRKIPSFPQPAATIVAVQQLQPHQQQSHPRRQIFWNTAHISTATKFVLDVQANQAFGFGPEGKERLASKHPELIRYLPDTQDRDWLTTQHIIPQQSRNSRFLLLIYDEICRLYQNHDVYKNAATIDLTVMMTFTVPDFMIQKMKIFFVDLNIKSRGLITNSYSISASSTQQPLQQTNSHLRNALLLGTQHSLITSAVTSSNVISASDSSYSSLVGSSSPSSTETLPQQKSKSSNLSSSHATLTALLNNSSASTTKATLNLMPINEKCNNSSPSSSINSTLSSSVPTLFHKLRK